MHGFTLPSQSGENIKHLPDFSPVRKLKHIRLVLELHVLAITGHTLYEHIACAPSKMSSWIHNKVKLCQIDPAHKMSETLIYVSVSIGPQPSQ